MTSVLGMAYSVDDEDKDLFADIIVIYAEYAVSVYENSSQQWVEIRLRAFEP